MDTNKNIPQHESIERPVDFIDQQKANVLQLLNIKVDHQASNYLQELLLRAIEYNDFSVKQRQALIKISDDLAYIIGSAHSGYPVNQEQASGMLQRTHQIRQNELIQANKPGEMCDLSVTAKASVVETVDVITESALNTTEASGLTQERQEEYLGALTVTVERLRSITLSLDEIAHDDTNALDRRTEKVSFELFRALSRFEDINSAQPLLETIIAVQRALEYAIRACEEREKKSSDVSAHVRNTVDDTAVTLDRYRVYAASV